MIKSSEQTIWVRESDGSLLSFEVEDVQSSLYAAFVKSGRSEGYLAEDLALALEFILLSTERENRIFLRSELDSAMARILSDAGYPEVLAAWRGANGSAALDLTVSVERPMVEELIGRHMNVSGTALETLSRRVLAALEALRLKECRPALIVELARHYERAGMPVLEGGLPAAAERGGASSWPAGGTGIVERLPDGARALFDAGILTLTPVSRLFPSLRLTLRLTALAAHAGWTPPVTEMMIYGDFIQLGRRLAEVRREAARTAGELPFYLTVPDLSEFTLHWLEAGWPEGRRSALELIQLIFDGMGDSPFKLRVM